MTSRTGRARAAARAAGLLLAGAVACASGTAGAAALPAAADTQDGLWYYTVGGVEAAHASTTGEGITIAVLDGPVNPDAPDLVGSTLVVRESFCDSADGVTPTETTTDQDAGHATAIAALLVGTGAGTDGQPGVRGVAPGATLLHYSIQPRGFSNEQLASERQSCVFQGGADAGRVIAASIDDAVAQGADIISMSTGGAWLPDVGQAVARAYAAGTIILGAPSNEGGTHMGFPADGNGVVAVEMADAAGQLDEDGDTTESPWLAVVAPGEGIRAPAWSEGRWDSYELVDGTSFATPWTAGVLALAWSLHPEATGNQMIQALIRTTNGGGDLVHDDRWGYGPVSVRGLIESDPTQYPDVNPFLRPLDDLEAVPTTQEILDAAGGPSPSATSTPEPEATPEARAGDRDRPEASAFPVLPVVGGAAVLLVAVAAAVVLGRRRSAAATPPGPGHPRKDI